MYRTQAQGNCKLWNGSIKALYEVFLLLCIYMYEYVICQKWLKVTTADRVGDQVKTSISEILIHLFLKM